MGTKVIIVGRFYLLEGSVVEVFLAIVLLASTLVNDCELVREPSIVPFEIIACSVSGRGSV